MRRRQFLTASAVAVAGSVLGPFGFAADRPAAGKPLMPRDIAGAVTLYSEFRVAQHQQAAGPVGAMVEVGSVEPFYLTRASVSGA